jgi:hypothetical protein
LQIGLTSVRGRIKMARKKKPSIHPLLATGREYCEKSSPHGFNYWVTCTKINDRIFWVITVMIGVACSTYFCKTAINDWIKSPTQTTINALGIPISQMRHPAITVCKENSVYDVGEYIRAVFNNFQFACNDSISSQSCQPTTMLRNHYSKYSKVYLKPYNNTLLAKVFVEWKNSSVFYNDLISCYSTLVLDLCPHPCGG